MKNNGDFRDSVFGKAAAYKEAGRFARKKRMKAVLATAICLLVLIPAVYIPVSVSLGNISTAVTTTPCATCAGTTTELATGQTTSALATTTTTTIATTTRACTTYTTTTLDFTWASTTTACGPGEAMGVGSFFNGANHIMQEYDAKYSGFRTEVEYSLTEELADYFSEEFFADNAVITVRLNAGKGSAAPCFLDMEKELDGSLRIDIGLPVAESIGGEATWLIMIPVSLDTLEGVKGIEVYGNDLFVSE